MNDRTLFQTLSGFLEADPFNRQLLVDAAEAALDERRPDVATDLLERAAALGERDARETNLAALAALQRQDFAAAASLLSALLVDGEDAPGLRYNLAWARAQSGESAAALDVLDHATAIALPQAATLRIGLLHEAGEIDAAMNEARALRVVWPQDERMMATISVLAIDAEDLALAADAAAGGGDRPEALATLGTLALGRDHATDAEALFDRALAQDERQARAWIGRGLARLLTGNAAAAADIDRGAEMFGDHLGSWLAAGWAHFAAGDPTTAKNRFEKALGLDETFAESHGSLAVIAVLEGDRHAAERASETALRLDRNCYSAALARTLLSSAAGDEEAARRIFSRAVDTPVDGSGRTIAHALATMGMRPHSN